MHKPVLLQEVLHTLAPRPKEAYIDATFGAGGYTRAILDAEDCLVTAFDRDPEAKARAKEIAAAYPDRFTFFQDKFGSMADILHGNEYDGIVFDLGVSSPQIDEAKRGFSFKHEGPLDMRMEKKGLSAADVVNTFEEKEIADILWTYGEERRSRSIAKAIVTQRQTKQFQTTTDLADLVRSIVKFERPGFDPATRTFQALRLYVNDELGELEKGLEASEKLLKQGGRLIVVSFHSLEDRIVKRFLTDRSGVTPKGSRHRPEAPQRVATFSQPTRKSILPSPDEIASNPRARSARLRWAVRQQGGGQ